MTQGAVVEWFVSNGGSVTEGQPIYLLETEETQNEVAAPASGTITINSELDVMYDVGIMIA
jgi:pyruvate/2-oxoglutarate dehydrogenase complex dihydrolipoamide acyltransferase (E2) component